MLPRRQSGHEHERHLSELNNQPGLLLQPGECCHRYSALRFKASFIPWKYLLGDLMQALTLAFR
jgi:hypothetical protein